MTDSAASAGKGSRSRRARAERKTVAVSTRLLGSKYCTTTRTHVLNSRPHRGLVVVVSEGGLEPPHP